MTGGSLHSSNLIALGYAPSSRATRVDHVGRGRWRNFGRRSSCAWSPIRRAAAQVPALAEMAENCRCCSSSVEVVARFASHGRVKVELNQLLEPSCRLIGGLTARPSAPGARAARRVARTGGASPFGRPPGPTRVASASRQIHDFSAQGRPDQCLRLPSSRSVDARTFGSGFGAFFAIPTNGVGGLQPRSDARNGSAGRVNGADGESFGGWMHEAGAPFVERAGKATPTAPAVNEPSQKSVDNAK